MIDLSLEMKAKWKKKLKPVKKQEVEEEEVFSLSLVLHNNKGPKMNWNDCCYFVDCCCCCLESDLNWKEEMMLCLETSMLMMPSTEVWFRDSEKSKGPSSVVRRGVDCKSSADRQSSVNIKILVIKQVMQASSSTFSGHHHDYVFG